MEPVGSVHSATYPYFEQYQFSPLSFSNRRLILILTFHLRLSLPSGLFSFSHQSPVCTPPPHRTCCMCGTSHSSLSAGPNRIFGEEYRLWNSSLYSLVRFPFTSSLLSPDILFSTLFSNTLCLCSSLNVSGRVSHTYKTRHSYISVH